MDMTQIRFSSLQTSTILCQRRERTTTWLLLVVEGERGRQAHTSLKTELEPEMELELSNVGGLAIRKELAAYQSLVL